MHSPAPRAERRCCECGEAIARHSALLCSDCGGLFHYADERIGERGNRCGRHEVGFRETLGRDIVPLCLRCEVAFRIRWNIPGVAER